MYVVANLSVGDGYFCINLSTFVPLKNPVSPFNFAELRLDVAAEVLHGDGGQSVYRARYWGEEIFFLAGLEYGSFVSRYCA